MFDDDEVRPKTPLLATPPLDRLGVEELRSYVGGLRGEIVRAEAEITRKQGLLTAANSVFRTP